MRCSFTYAIFIPRCNMWECIAVNVQPHFVYLHDSAKYATISLVFNLIFTLHEMSLNGMH